MTDMHDLAALYVVDALDPDEEVEFEIHLADCDECQREVNDMRRVAEGLSGSVSTDPPATLRSSVLAEIAGTAQESHENSRTRPTSRTSESSRPRQAGTTSETGEARDARIPSRPSTATTVPVDNVVVLRPRRSGRIPSLLAAAAVLAAVAFGGYALQTRHNAQQADSRQAELVSLLGASDVRTVSGSVPGGGSGTLVLSGAQGKAVFVTAGMPALPGSRVYELWTVAGTPVAAGTFSGTGSGSVVALPAAALSASRVAITVEPAGGSVHPTTSPVMSLVVPRSS